MTTRIAMWSGPRNISTAMLRAWGNRPDTWVCDEPLYAHYLDVTGFDHPGAAEIIAHHENDWTRVVHDDLLAPIPHGRAIYYQKHMAHHLLPEIDRAWLDDVTNGFLIRNPREMVLSLSKVLDAPTLPDTGLPQQVEIFRQVRARTGVVPPVLDAKDVLEDPPRLLGLLCDAVGVPFTDAMLSWPPGRRETDGIWARHWYASVEASTAFAPYTPRTETLPESLVALHEQCLPYYDELFAHRLGAD